MGDKCPLRLHVPNGRLATFWIQPYPIQSFILSLGQHHSSGHLSCLLMLHSHASFLSCSLPGCPFLLYTALALISSSLSSSIVHLRSESVTHLNQVHIGHESLDLPDDLRLSGGIEFLKFNGENCLLLGLLFSRGFSR